MEATFGEADILARAKNSSVEGNSRNRGSSKLRAGKVRLINRGEYPDDWDPTFG